MDSNINEFLESHVDDIGISYYRLCEKINSYINAVNESNNEVYKVKTSDSNSLALAVNEPTKVAACFSNKKTLFIGSVSKIVSLLFVLSLSLISYLLPHYLLNASLLDILSINYKLDFLSNLDYKNWHHFVLIKDFCGTVVKCLPVIGLFSFLSIPYIFLYGEKTKFANIINLSFGAGILASVVCYVFFNSYIYREFEDCQNSISCYAISASFLFIFAIVTYNRISRKQDHNGPYMLTGSLVIPFIFTVSVLIFALVFGTIAYLFYNFAIQIFIIIILLFFGSIFSSYSTAEVVKYSVDWIVYYF